MPFGQAQGPKKLKPKQLKPQKQQQREQDKCF